MRYSKITVSLSLLGAIFCFFAVPAYAQDFPVCQYAASDDNSDGYGWENRATCIVTNASSPEAVPMQCVDDDGDGWGWNGVQVCRIAQACIDTAPVGDGWGWDGSQSCNIPAYQAPFSELEILNQHSRPQLYFSTPVSTASLQCSQNQGIVRFHLRADGRLNRESDGSTQSGYWSAGFSDEDGMIVLWRVNESWIILTPNSVSVRQRAAGGDLYNCFWE